MLTSLIVPHDAYRKHLAGIFNNASSKGLNYGDDSINIAMRLKISVLLIEDLFFVKKQRLFSPFEYQLI